MSPAKEAIKEIDIAEDSMWDDSTSLGGLKLRPGESKEDA